MNLSTILVVDDDENDLLFARRAFEKAGVVNPLQVVTDGHMAIEYLSGAGPFANRETYPLPGLIISDFKLPLNTGLELVRWIRSQPGIRRIPVLILSSTASPRDINEVYDAGANAFLIKPSGVQELVALIHAIKSFWLENNYMPEVAV